MRPERTRAHYIESVSRNYVERFIVLQGHVAERPLSDYGYDLVVTTFDFQGDPHFSRGEVENGAIYLQLKSTDKLKTLITDKDALSFEIKQKHARYWVFEPMPVILIVYSVERNEAYWLYMQPYLRSSAFQWPANQAQDKITIHMSRSSVLDGNAIEDFSQRQGRHPGKSRLGAIVHVR